MKNTLSILLLAASSVVLTAPAKAANPCQQILCLSGVMAGKGVVSGCSGAVGDYFSNIGFKHGSFSPSETAKKRKKELNKCPAAGADVIEKINNKFGRLRGL
ncbi:hypothetical protein D2B43_18085 [Salmonella enterica]|nr:hypothetical protein [Salmonella enterica]